MQANELLVYAFVYHFSQGNGFCLRCAPAFIGKMCGNISVPTVKKILASLHQKNLLVYNDSKYAKEIEISTDVGRTFLNGDDDSKKDVSREIPKKKTKVPFSIPSVEEIAEYCIERNNGIDPEEFYDHYEANGWLVGKVPMKDWKAAVRTWERRRMSPRSSAPQSKAQRGKSNLQEAAKRILTSDSLMFVDEDAV